MNNETISKTIKLVTVKNDSVAEDQQKQLKQYEGRLITFLGGHCILIATPTNPTLFGANYLIPISKFETENIELANEVKIVKNHLHKMIKQKLN